MAGMRSDLLDRCYQVSIPRFRVAPLSYARRRYPTSKWIGGEGFAPRFFSMSVTTRRSPCGRPATAPDGGEARPRPTCLASASGQRRPCSAQDHCFDCRLAYDPAQQIVGNCLAVTLVHIEIDGDSPKIVSNSLRLRARLHIRPALPAREHHCPAPSRSQTRLTAIQTCSATPGRPHHVSRPRRLISASTNSVSKSPGMPFVYW